MKDQFAEIVHKRLCELPEDTALKHPVFWVLYIAKHEAYMHPIYYVKHRMMGLMRRYLA
jgi:hypothetical protein